MGLGKIIILIVALLIGTGWAMASGSVGLADDDYKCYLSKTFIKVGERQRLFSLGRLTFYYQPYDYNCIPEARYNPDIYRIKNGVLETIPNRTSE